MSGELLVREARLDDDEGFVRAHESAWNSTIGEIVATQLDELAPFEARLEHYRESIGKVSAERRVWVAERAGRIVGVSVALRASPESVELRDLYVVPEAWGTGVARPLMNAALESVQGSHRDAVLWVGEANARARRFYEREGWAADGASRTSPLGPRELRYRRLLGARTPN